MQGDFPVFIIIESYAMLKKKHESCTLSYIEIVFHKKKYLSLSSLPLSGMFVLASGGYF
jgi:hypothetical protein